jgi:hypothetical protein
MRKYDGRLVGILGTVIIHLIAGILFMSFQLRSLSKNISETFEMEFAPEEVSETKPKLVELPATSVEKILQGDEDMLNIARNMANKSEVKTDPEDYINAVKDELIKSGKLGVDNFIDDQKKLNEMNPDDKIAIENESNEKSKPDKPKESQEMAANYKGPTRIYYDLLGRTHTYLPIPIYKCQGSGRVVLAIDVNQKGIVEKAQVISNESTTSDDCLIETAVTTALLSRFNGDLNSPRIQSGTLSYQFVAQ